MIHDVAVVGGGPAGATAAWRLAGGGLQVVLLERERLPRYKTCGGGVLGRVLAWLPEGLPLEPEAVVHEARLHLPREALRFAVRRPEPMIVMTMRDHFDAVLVDAARTAGAVVRDGSAVEGLELRDEEVRLRTSAGTVRARYVIGADGALGAVARHAGWPPRPGIPALECELPVDGATLERFSGAARFDLGFPDDGYAWVFPKRSHLSVGVLCMRRRPARLKELLRDYLNRLGIDAASIPHLHGFQIPVRPRPEGVVGHRVLLVGDAAGLADPITAEGISHAIRSARLAADAVLRHERSPGEAARVYAGALREDLLPDLRAAHWLARLLYGVPAVRGPLFRRWGAEFCEAVAEVILGRATYRELLATPSNYVRLLRKFARAEPDGPAAAADGSISRPARGRAHRPARLRTQPALDRRPTE